MQKKLYSFFFDDLLKSSWRSVVLLWKPMAGWTILVYLVFTALSAPFFAFLLDWSVFRGDRIFVGNDDLYTWFISPAGFVYLFVLILIALTGIVIRYAGLFQIVRDHLLGEPVSVRYTALRIFARVHLLVKICAITIAGFLVSLIPLALGLVLIYSIYLTQFDLNYYWISRPPEWHRALLFGGSWAGLWFVAALGTAATLLPALPCYLEGKKTFFEAIKNVWNTPLTQTLRFLKVITMATTAWFLGRIFAEAVLFTGFLFLADWAAGYFDSLRPLAFIAGGYFFSTLTAGAVISFFGFSLISAIITKFYFTFSRPEIISATPGFKNLTLKTIRLLTWWSKPVRAAALIAAITAGSIISSFLIAGTPEHEDSVLVIAHRANALGAPENSLPALENSISLGVDVVEIDVQLTADGTVVVLHDEDLMRVTGDPRKIAEISDEELSHLRLLTNGNYPDSKLRVPALAEYLEKSKGRIVVMIELKYYGFNPELAEKTVQLVRDFEMEAQVQIKSLTYSAVEQVRELAPDLELGYVSAAALGDISRLQVRFLSVNHTGITPELVRRLALQEMNLYVWTVNTRDGMIDAILKGANGIITDRPEVAIELIEEIGGLAATERLLLQMGLFILESQRTFAGGE